MSSKQQTCSLIFNRFEMIDSGNPVELERQRSARRKRMEKTRLVGNNPSKLLQRIERNRKKRGPDLTPEGGDFEQRVRNATDRARGLVIRDDEHLLRRAVRKREAQQRQSARKWASRERNVKQQIADRQRRRAENIDKRRQQRIDKKKARRARR